MLDERKTAILRAVVHEYIETAQPVGSGHVARRPGVSVSAATVRNEMAVLEQEGYLVQPHTSAGRVPTDKGYRFFVDHLTEPGRLERAKVQQVRDFFDSSHGAIEQLLQDTTRLLAGLTDYAAVILGPSPEAATIRSIQVVGLSSRVAMVVAVLSNGAVESFQIELDDDTADARLAAASAHLQAHLGPRRSPRSAMRCATTRTTCSSAGRRGWRLHSTPSTSSARSCRPSSSSTSWCRCCAMCSTGA
jgi:heat-inducible transcriptional repressor